MHAPNIISYSWPRSTEELSSKLIFTLPTLKPIVTIPTTPNAQTASSTYNPYPSGLQDSLPSSTQPIYPNHFNTCYPQPQFNSEYRISKETSTEPADENRMAIPPYNNDSGPGYSNQHLLDHFNVYLNKYPAISSTKEIPISNSAQAVKSDTNISPVEFFNELMSTRMPHSSQNSVWKITDTISRHISSTSTDATVSADTISLAEGCFPGIFGLSIPPKQVIKLYNESKTSPTRVFTGMLDLMRDMEPNKGNLNPWRDKKRPNMTSNYNEYYNPSMNSQDKYNPSQFYPIDSRNSNASHVNVSCTNSSLNQNKMQANPELLLETCIKVITMVYGEHLIPLIELLFFFLLSNKHTWWKLTFYQNPDISLISLASEQLAIIIHLSNCILYDLVLSPTLQEDYLDKHKENTKRESKHAKKPISFWQHFTCYSHKSNKPSSKLRHKSDLNDSSSTYPASSPTLPFHTEPFTSHIKLSCTLPLPKSKICTRFSHSRWSTQSEDEQNDGVSHVQTLSSQSSEYNFSDYSNFSQIEQLEHSFQESVNLEVESQDVSFPPYNQNYSHSKSNLGTNKRADNQVYSTDTWPYPLFVSDPRRLLNFTNQKLDETRISPEATQGPHRGKCNQLYKHQNYQSLSTYYPSNNNQNYHQIHSSLTVKFNSNLHYFSQQYLENFCSHNPIIFHNFHLLNYTSPNLRLNFASPLETKSFEPIIGSQKAQILGHIFSLKFALNSTIDAKSLYEPSFLQPKLTDSYEITARWVLAEWMTNYLTHLLELATSNRSKKAKGSFKKKLYLNSQKNQKNSNNYLGHSNNFSNKLAIGLKHSKAPTNDPLIYALCLYSSSQIFGVKSYRQFRGITIGSLESSFFRAVENWPFELLLYLLEKMNELKAKSAYLASRNLPNHQKRSNEHIYKRFFSYFTYFSVINERTLLPFISNRNKEYIKSDFTITYIRDAFGLLKFLMKLKHYKERCKFLRMLKSKNLIPFIPSAYKQPVVSIDCEGIHLGRKGEVCLIQLAIGEDFQTSYEKEWIMNKASQPMNYNWENFNNSKYNYSFAFSSKLLPTFVDSGFPLFFGEGGLELDSAKAKEILYSFTEHNLFSGTTFVIDTYLLGPKVFKICTPDQYSLKDFFADQDIYKLFFDARSDVDALYHQFGVVVNPIIDVQLMEVAVRLHNEGKADYLKGMNHATKKYHIFSSSQEHFVKNLDLSAKRLFEPRAGGAYQMFKFRPIHPTLLIYAGFDVRQLFPLFQKLKNLLVEDWWHSIEVESNQRSNYWKHTDEQLMNISRSLSPRMTPKALPLESPIWNFL